MTDRYAFEVLQWDLARVSDLFTFVSEGVHGTEWGIKGHNRAWAVQNGDWQTGMRALDVGAGYSDLPEHLAVAHGVDSWVADDYGAAQDEAIWSRWGDPAKLPEKFPHVNYVFQNLGKQVDELPDGTFDRVYSISVLEHIPPDLMEAVMVHMARLLKPGGLMMHTVDIPFPRTVERSGIVGLAALFGRIAARKVLIAAGARGHNPFLSSVEGWATFLRRLFKLDKPLHGISTPFMLLNHDVLAEPPEVVYRFYPPNDEPKPYWPAASLTFILRKVPITG